MCQTKSANFLNFRNGVLKNYEELILQVERTPWRKHEVSRNDFCSLEIVLGLPFRAMDFLKKVTFLQHPRIVDKQNTKISKSED